MRERIELLYDISRKLSSRLDLNQVLSDILSLTVPSVEASKGSIMVFDESGQACHQILARKGLSRPVAEQVVAQVLDKGLAGWVVKHKQGVVVFDTKEDERWLVLDENHRTTRSVIIVPLLRQNRVVGVLTLGHPEPNRFSEEHLDLLSSIANQAAIAVENARLYEDSQRRLHELSVLYEVSQAASSLNLDEALCLIAEKTARALHTKRCAIFLLDEKNQELILRVADSPHRPVEIIGLRLPLEARPHVAEAIASQKPVKIPDVFADPRLQDFWPYARRQGLASHLSVPIVAKGRAIGAFSLDRAEASPPFSADQVALCQTIAHQTATAIQNAQLYQEAQYIAERLHLVSEVAYDIGTILDVDLLLWEIVRLIRETLDCYHVSIGLVEGDELSFRADVGYYYKDSRVTGTRLKIGEEGITGWVAQKGEPLLVPDVSQDRRYYAVDELPETKSELAVPLKIQDRVIGVLDAQSNRLNDFNQGDQALLQSLAAQVAVAVESARLFDAVRDERAKLEAIIRGASDAIFVTDDGGRVLLMNPAAEQAFDVESGTGGDRPLETVIRNADLLALWRSCFVTDSGSCSAEIPLADGRTLYAHLTPIAGVGQMAVMRDITHLKELDKMKSEFVSTVSHDLGSPLQIIQTSAELIPRLGPINRSQQDAADDIVRTVTKTATLVQDLLDLGKIEARVEMEMEPCQLATIIDEAVESLEERAKAKEVALQTTLPQTLPLVMGNPIRLGQVVTNLVNNAIKFTPSGGTVTISARETEGEVAVDIRDTGIGIPPEDQAHVFDKFYRVKSAKVSEIEGTGLGLAIVKSIVEGHSGRVWVESEPGQGSTFGFALSIVPH